MATKPKEKDLIEIRGPQIKQMAVRIVGTSSLLTNRMSEKSRAALTETAPTRQRGPKVYDDPEDVWRSHLHVIDADASRYGIPGAAMFGALVRAAAFEEGIAMTEARGMFRIPFGLLEIEGVAPVRSDSIGWPQRGGPPVPIYRPEFAAGWEIEVPVEYDESLISQASFLNLFARAGFSVGIGAFRPERDGCHGTFRVKSVEFIGQETAS